MADIEFTDEELVRGALNGEHPAFAQIVEKYRDRLYAICYGHVLDHEEAADLVQDVFIQAYRKLDTLREWNRLGPFLAKIAKNYSLNRIKARKRRSAAKDRLEDRLVSEQAAAQDLSEAERNDLHAVLRTLVKTLPASSREVVLLHYFEEMSTPDIAEFLDIRQPAVLQRLHYGRKLLRTRMEHELKPALENEEQRKKHIQAIVAAIPFGNAPWTGSPIPVQPALAGQSRPLAAVKVGAAGLSLAAAGLAVWFVLATLNQPNPPVQNITADSITAANESSSVAPGLSERAALTPPPTEPKPGLPESAQGPDGRPLVGPDRTGPIELTFGPPPWKLPQAHRSAMGALIDAYNAMTPGVHIRLAPDHARVDAAAVDPERVGDIILDESIRLGGTPVLARLRDLGALAELDPNTRATGFDIEDYYPNVLDLVRADGKVWGVPFLTVSWAFAIPSQFEEEPWIAQHFSSWDNLPDVLSALWLDTGDGSGRRDSVALLDPEIVWMSYFLGVGGSLNDPKSMRSDGRLAIQSIEQLMRCVRLNQPAFDSENHDGKDASSPSGTSFRVVTDLLGGAMSSRNGGPLPTLLTAPGTGPIPSMLSHVLAVKRSTPERERAAWEFVRWATSREISKSLYEEQGILPLRKSLRHVASTTEERVFLEQIQRMQFQNPDSGCVEALEHLRAFVREELRRQYRQYASSGVMATHQ